MNDTSQSFRIALFILFLLLMIIVIPIISTDSNDTDSGSSPASSSSISSRKIEAWVMAQNFVEDRLKSPGTASYGGIFGQDPDNVVSYLGDGKYRVSAWVDSQNAFGATIRTRFVCELEHEGGDSWRCTSLVFVD